MIQVSIPEAVAAGTIAAPSRAASRAIAERELGLFLALLESIEPGEWSLPTACSLWDVRDVTAHEAGHVSPGFGIRRLLAQQSPLRVRKYRSRGLYGNDAANQCDVDERRHLEPAAIIQEIREGTPRAIAARQRMGPVSRLLRVPVPDYGMMTFDYLLHVIFPRDMWIHRLDISDATGRTLDVSAEHDRLLLHHAIGDMDRNVRKRLPGRAVLLMVDGPAGGQWRLGEGDEVTVRIDLAALLRRMSGRTSAAEALPVAEISQSGAEAGLQVLESLVAVF